MRYLKLNNFKLVKRVVVAVIVVVGFTTMPVQQVSITTDVVSSILDQGEVYNIM